MLKWQMLTLYYRLFIFQKIHDKGSVVQKWTSQQIPCESWITGYNLCKMYVVNMPLGYFEIIWSCKQYWQQSLESGKGWASQVALVVKNPPASARDLRDPGLIPGLGRSPGGEHGNPLQYSCLENPTDRAGWRAAVHKVAKSRTQLSNLAHMQLRGVLVVR